MTPFLVMLKSNWRLVVAAAVIALWFGSLAYVSKSAKDERDAYWQAKIASTPVKVETTYVRVPYSVPAPSSNPRSSDQLWRSKLDSIQREAGRSIVKLREELDKMAAPYENEYVDAVEAVARDEGRSFTVPFKLTVRSLPALKMSEYVLEVEPFEVPSKVITIEKSMLREHAWHELTTTDAVIVLASAVAGYFIIREVVP